MPNPRLTDWLAHYADAAVGYAEQETAAAFLPDSLHRIPPRRPLAMCWTLDGLTGELSDHEGTPLGNVSELSVHDCRMLGLNPTGVTMPRRNPQTIQPARFLPDGRAIFDGDQLPDEARPGDVVLRDGRPDGIIGLNASNRVVILPYDPAATPPDRDPFNGGTGDIGMDAPPMEPDARLARIETALNEVNALEEEVGAHRRASAASMGTDLSRDPGVPTVILPGGNTITGPSITSTLSAAVANATQSISNMAAALGAPAPEPETYEGPVMVASTATESGAAARYRAHTADAEAALQRAFTVQREYPSLRALASRARLADEQLTGEIVARQERYVQRIMVRGYGIELNDAALHAVTAMVTTVARQAAAEPIRRAQSWEASCRTAQTNSLDAQRERDERTRERDEARREAERARRANTHVSPGTVEAAVAAARTWKSTGIEDSVAKRDSFIALLAALDRLAG